ncbi:MULTISPECIES: rhodanese-like domain-containing protein [unclassified Rhodococcus (in: high G+C Gram-positive bacteria)]|uniref:rhodanese-like domain-containing protein n=1 Tax=unclassified Rhodococcus (in: high G+C Gram-positive bacteria) TaxID=192944 RepID=UPI00339B76C9
MDQLAFYQQKLEYEIDSWDLYAALQSQGELGTDVVVVDGRSTVAYDREHIPGAVSIPHKTISQESLTGFDRAPLYVTYCDGIGCNASTKTAMKLVSLGFRVKEMLGGLDWWKRDGYATEGQDGRPGVEVPACGCDGEAG